MIHQGTDEADILTAEDDRRLSSLLIAWHEGIPAREMAIWRTLDRSRRELAAERIKALISYEKSGDWGRHAEHLGLSKPGFFSLAGRWRRNRSIASVVPNVNAKTRVGGGRPVTPSHRRLLGRIRKENPFWSREKVVEEILRRAKDAPSAGVLRILVDEFDLEAERMADDVSGVGARLVIGTCPVVLRPVEAVEWRPAAHGGFVIDLFSGDILGCAASLDEHVAFRDACLSAAQFVDGIQFGGAGHQEPQFECHVAGQDLGKLTELLRLRALPLRITDAELAGRRMHGSRFVQLLGPRLGVLDLRPRAEVPFRTLADNARNAPDPAEAILPRLVDEVTRRRSERKSAHTPPVVQPSVLAAALRMIAG